MPIFIGRGATHDFVRNHRRATRKRGVKPLINHAWHFVPAAVDRFLVGQSWAG
jgi:hypothetical protein